MLLHQSRDIVDRWLQYLRLLVDHIHGSGEHSRCSRRHLDGVGSGRQLHARRSVAAGARALRRGHDPVDAHLCSGGKPFEHNGAARLERINNQINRVTRVLP